MSAARASERVRESSLGGCVRACVGLDWGGFENKRLKGT